MLSLALFIIVVIVLLILGLAIIGAFIGIIGAIFGFFAPLIGVALIAWLCIWLFGKVTGRQILQRRNYRSSSFDNEWYVIDKKRKRRYRNEYHDDNKWSDF